MQSRAKRGIPCRRGEYETSWIRSDRSFVVMFGLIGSVDPAVPQLDRISRVRFRRTLKRHVYLLGRRSTMITTTAMRIPEMRWKKDAVDANRKKSIAMRMRWALSRKAEEREGNARKERGGGVLHGGVVWYVKMVCQKETMLVPLCEPSHTRWSGPVRQTCIEVTSIASTGQCCCHAWLWRLCRTHPTGG
jgi:hypothetical protein